MSLQDRIRNLKYLSKALEQHKRTVALIITVTLTAPLFVFTSLPPIEVLDEVLQEVEEEVLVSREFNITEERVINNTITTNITEGGNVFLEPQPAPPLIDSDIVLCIDVSGSMDSDRMPLAQAAINNTVKMLNQSFFANLSNDRIALVAFSQGIGVGPGWTDDAIVLADLDYVSNQTHLNHIFTENRGLSGSGWTDAWAGLNYSLDLLLDNPRNTSVLKTIIFLTDGAHNIGPWDDEVSGPSPDYTGFLNDSSTNGGSSPYSESPVAVARNNSVKIYSIGLFRGTADFDEDFLTNISLHPTFGTFGDFFAGNDTLSMIESFSRARDDASGWFTSNDFNGTVLNSGNNKIFSFNVTQEVRRLKWDFHWNNSAIDFNLTVKNPNNTIIPINTNTTEDIIPILLQKQKSIVFDFPMLGIWQFNISWKDIIIAEPILSRLATYEPPIFIKSITQLNSSIGSQSLSLLSIDRDGSDLSYSSIDLKLYSSKDENSTLSKSVLFMINVTNKNPLFSYHNITPFLLANFTDLNTTYSWDPPLVSKLDKNNTVSFTFNLTFLEPTFLQGQFFFKVNCTEGYYDAITKEVALDYRVNTQNITVETYTENQTVLTTVFSQSYETRLKTSYSQRVFDTLKWGGLFISFGILMSFLVVYVSAQAYHLRNIAERFRSRLFPDPSALEEALQKEGISVTSEDLNQIIASTDDLDQFGQYIHELTGVTLSPEDLIRITSGVSIAKIVERLSTITDSSKEELLAQLKDAPSIQALLRQLNLEEEKLLDIITQDEQVVNFQEKVARLIRQPVPQKMSSIVMYDDLDVNQFRNRLKRLIKPE